MKLHSFREYFKLILFCITQYLTSFHLHFFPITFTLRTYKTSMTSCHHSERFRIFSQRWHTDTHRTAIEMKINFVDLFTNLYWGKFKNKNHPLYFILKRILKYGVKKKFLNRKQVDNIWTLFNNLSLHFNTYKVNIKWYFKNLYYLTF